jgi:hypothetical protein
LTFSGSGKKPGSGLAPQRMDIALKTTRGQLGALAAILLLFVFTAMLFARRTDTANLRKIVADPRAAFVAHTAKYTYLPQQRALLEDAAAGAGYEEVPVEIVYDHYGRATFEVFRFRKIPL